MKEQLQKIDDLISKHKLKKAEITIAKHFRSDLSIQYRSQMLLRRTRVRLLCARPDDALDDLETIRNDDPTEFDSPLVLELLGDCYFARFELASLGFTDRNDALMAQQAYERIVHEYPKYSNLGWIYYQFGRILVTTNQTDKAVQYFRQALVNPSHISELTAYCYERLAFVAFYENRDPDQALAFVNRAIDTFPASGDRNWLIQVHILHSRILRARRDYEMALKAAEVALSLVSSSVDNKSALSEILLTTGELLAELGNRDKEVITTVQQFIQISRKPLGIDVTWSRANEMLGNAYFNLGRYENAVSAYQAVLHYNPDYPWNLSLYYRIAMSHYHQRAYWDTITVIYQMLDIATSEEQTVSDYRIYDILGDANFALKRYEEAVEAYQTALLMAPPNADNLSKIKSYYELARDRV